MKAEEWALEITGACICDPITKASGVVNVKCHFCTTGWLPVLLRDYGNEKLEEVVALGAARAASAEQSAVDMRNQERSAYSSCFALQAYTLRLFVNEVSALKDRPEEEE